MKIFLMTYLICIEKNYLAYIIFNNMIYKISYFITHVIGGKFLVGYRNYVPTRDIMFVDWLKNAKIFSQSFCFVFFLHFYVKNVYTKFLFKKNCCLNFFTQTRQGTAHAKKPNRPHKTQPIRSMQLKNF